MLMRYCLFLSVAVSALWLNVSPTSAAPADQAGSDGYEAIVRADRPVAYWRFNGEKALRGGQAAQAKLQGAAVGSPKLAQPGPRADGYPLFSKQNQAIALGASAGYIKVADPGTDSPLDFDNGDAITLEAWVNPSGVTEGQQVYIVGKGRTGNPGVAAENQNYSLRLRCSDGSLRVSFLFRGKGTSKTGGDEFHRWNSSKGFYPDGRWRHVAVTYKFGDALSIRGYINGQPVPGTWDIGGPTKAPPVVDNDELWIGSSVGGKLSSTFHGLLDEVAIYRTALSAERIQTRYRSDLKEPEQPDFSAAPTDSVLVEIVEGIPDSKQWPTIVPPVTESYDHPAFAFVGVPRKYTEQGVIADRSNPFLVRSRTKARFAGGDYSFLLRARSAARLYIDGKKVADLSFVSSNGSGHEKVPELAPQNADLYPLPQGQREKIVQVRLEEGEHHFRWELVVGGKNMRTEIGEPVIGFSLGDQPYQVLTPSQGEPQSLSVAAWEAFQQSGAIALRELNQQNRQAASIDYGAYWKQRHAIAKAELKAWPKVEAPGLPEGMPANNVIDHFLGAALKEADASPTELTNDDQFLRRLALDTVGRIPSPREITAYYADPVDRRRSLAIDRYLASPEWADHWTSYWQDVLAENPGILKPKLNNTGPFRWWIYESLLDNKPMDRFVTELVMMQGSKYGGGPAGFAMATQNDAPMAAKAHVLSTAFLGVEMKCARCHDAPFHPFKQAELFSLAAMLERKTVTLPKSSTVPPPPKGGRIPEVVSTLKPGAKIVPQWAFTSLSPELPRGVAPKSDDPRAELAAAITSPRNHRFAQVMVNRLWARYLGVGLVKSTDDWHDAEASHPELLDYLARDFVANAYDMQHTSRLIFNSHAYQRHAIPTTKNAQQFAGPQRRRLTAEQIVDSLFATAGKPFYSEPLSLDPEGRRSINTFLNLGAPRKAWEFTSLSNERDRPALALPMAQSMIDLLLAFGWRDARPNPLTVREEPATVLQPLSIANGVASNRAVRLSDDHAVTELALQDISLTDLIDQVFLRVLTRPPTDEERAMFEAELSPGYSDRRILSAPVALSNAVRYRNRVSWSNHLNAEATSIKLELEHLVNEGDPPTKRLQPAWREKMEDSIWALINSPEFVFTP